MKAWRTVMLGWLAAWLLLPVSGAGEQTTYAIGRTAASELKIGLGPRAVGLGEAFVARADDVNALAWNPAGLVQLTGWNAAFMHQAYMQDSALDYLAYAQRGWRGGGWGANLIFFNYGGFERYTEIGGLPQAAGNFSASAVALAAGAGQLLTPNLAGGGALKYFNQTIDGQAFTALGLDLGLLIRPGVTGLQLGLALQNLGLSVSQASLPTAIKAGAAYVLPFELGADDSWSALVEVDLPWADLQFTSLRLGTEYWIAQTVALRLGYKAENRGDTGSLAGLTAGAGIRLGLFSLDYALGTYGNLGLTHQVSLTVAVRPEPKARVAKKQRAKAEPAPAADEQP